MEEQQAKPAGLSPFHLAKRALRYYKLALVVMAVGVAATVLIARSSKQVYRSEAVLLYRQTGQRGYGEMDSSRRVGTRLQDMLYARDRLLGIVRELRVYPDIANPHEAADALRRKIAFLVRDGSTFVITFDAETPQMAQAVTQRLAQSLVDDNNRQRATEAEQTRVFLDAERKKVDEEVRQKEAALARFLQAHPEAVTARMGLSGGGSDDSGRDELEAELARLRASRTEGRDQQPRTDGELLATQRRLEMELLSAERELAERSQKLTDRHPDLIAARERVKRAEADVNRLRSNVEAASQATAQRSAGAAATGSEASREIAALEQRAEPGAGTVSRSSRPSRSSSGPRISRSALKTEVELESLRHDLEQARERLAELGDQEFQATLVARMASSGDIGQLVVLDPAYLPGLPFVDTKKKVTMGGFALALMLALGAALLRARTDDRLYDAADVEWLTGRQVLVSVPRVNPPKRMFRSERTRSADAA